MAGRILSDLGAEVIKLELPPAGDYSRGRMPKPSDGHRFSPMHAYYNRGKGSLCIDFKRPEGAALVKELISHFDVFLENLTPGLLGKYGLGYDDLKTINPHGVVTVQKCKSLGIVHSDPVLAQKIVKMSQSQNGSPRETVLRDLNNFMAGKKTAKS